MFILDIQRRFLMLMRGYFWMPLKEKEDSSYAAMNWMLLGHSLHLYWMNLKRKR
jgi:hypothetical protein